MRKLFERKEEEDDSFAWYAYGIADMLLYVHWCPVIQPTFGPLKQLVFFLFLWNHSTALRLKRDLLKWYYTAVVGPFNETPLYCIWFEFYRCQPLAIQGTSQIFFNLDLGEKVWLKALQKVYTKIGILSLSVKGSLKAEREKLFGTEKVKF